MGLSATLKPRDEDLVRHLFSAHEAERTRLARIVHNELGQQVTALMLGLTALDPLHAPARTAAALPGLQRLCAELGKSLDRLCAELRPAALDDFGLVRALTDYLEDWARHAGVEVAFHASGFDGRRLPAALETTLYRIVQDAVGDALRHGGARRLSVVLQLLPGQAAAVIEDDGTGNPEDRPTTPSLRERAVLSNGELTAETAGQGTALYVRIPVPPLPPPS